jgi:hypothetical protein
MTSKSAIRIKRKENKGASLQSHYYQFWYYPAESPRNHHRLHICGAPKPSSESSNHLRAYHQVFSMKQCDKYILFNSQPFSYEKISCAGTCTKNYLMCIYSGVLQYSYPSWKHTLFLIIGRLRQLLHLCVQDGGMMCGRRLSFWSGGVQLGSCVGRAGLNIRSIWLLDILSSGLPDLAYWIACRELASRLSYEHVVGGLHLWRLDDMEAGD